jgi:hypothetical protein
VTELGQFALFMAVGAGAIGIFFGPVGKALGRLIEGRKRDGGSDAIVSELQARVAQLEAERMRMAELEERLDFAERMLTNIEPSARLPGRLDQ